MIDSKKTARRDAQAGVARGGKTFSETRAPGGVKGASRVGTKEAAREAARASGSALPRKGSATERLMMLRRLLNARPLRVKVQATRATEPLLNVLNHSSQRTRAESNPGYPR